jgi:hypothetical protein
MTPNWATICGRLIPPPTLTSHHLFCSVVSCMCPFLALSRVLTRVTCGRIFAHWVIVCIGQVFENYQSSPHFWAAFSHGGGDAKILTKKWLGHILGYFSNTLLVTLVLIVYIKLIKKSPLERSIDNTPQKYR